MNKIKKNYLREISKGLDFLSGSEKFEKQIEIISKLIIKTSDNDKLIVIYGNGGSAADAQHFSAELLGTFKNKNRRSFKSIALNTDTSFLTAWTNDFDFSTVFQRQIEALSQNIGLSIALSTSGKSINVINALKTSRLLGIKTILITGENCPDHGFIDHIVKLPSIDTSIIQTYTQIMYHLICLQFEDI